MTTQLSTNVQSRTETAPLLASPSSEKTWRYHTISVLLFVIEAQYKLLMLPVLAVVACLRFSFSSIEKLSSILTLNREISTTSIS